MCHIYEAKKTLIYWDVAIRRRALQKPYTYNSPILQRFSPSGEQLEHR